MKSLKPISIILNSFYTIIVVLFLLDALTAFDIKSQSIKSFIYKGLLIITIIVLIWNLLLVKSKNKKILAAILPVGILILIITTGPSKMLFASAAWHTQTILYQNEHLSFKKVEHQMQNALGYNQRTVEVLYLTKFFMIINEVPKGIETRVEWFKVNQDVNELGLKY